MLVPFFRPVAATSDMAPNMIGSPTEVLFENNIEPVAVPSVELRNGNAKPREKYKREIVWRNVILFAYLHLAAVYGAYLMLVSAKILTSVWGVYCNKCCWIYWFSLMWFVFQEHCKVND
jgi:stearoyl-CoA desaturase (delta-9 desaturase)